MSAPQGGARPRLTLADIYAERDLTTAQVRRIVALLRLTERPADRGRREQRDAA
jgi:hypothetical protein